MLDLFAYCVSEDDKRTVVFALRQVAKMHWRNDAEKAQRDNALRILQRLEPAKYEANALNDMEHRVKHMRQCNISEHLVRRMEMFVWMKRDEFAALH